MSNDEMSDLVYTAGVAFIASMYTLLVKDDGEWYDEALAAELVDLLPLADACEGQWSIVKRNEIVLIGNNDPEFKGYCGNAAFLDGEN